jgi:hypothetical protein
MITIATMNTMQTKIFFVLVVPIVWAADVRSAATFTLGTGDAQR